MGKAEKSDFEWKSEEWKANERISNPDWIALEATDNFSLPSEGQPPLSCHVGGKRRTSHILY